MGRIYTVFVIGLIYSLYFITWADKPATLVQLDDLAVTIEADEPAETAYRYIDCPLSKDLQQGIFDICTEYGVEFELVMALIEKESQWDIAATGDGGDSVGLMQVQEQWHYEVMEELGVSDLNNPLDNVRVGVAILADYIETSGDIDYSLMRYNGGNAYAKRLTKAGKVSRYAREIQERAAEYKEKSTL